MQRNKASSRKNLVLRSNLSEIRIVVIHMAEIEAKLRSNLISNLVFERIQLLITSYFANSTLSNSVYETLNEGVL